ncbi:MAG: HAD-IIIC family phosphatase [Roseivirga sp.]|nr:HAD-IIIC family phosphatase [Roseivirga sp.]
MDFNTLRKQAKKYSATETGKTVRVAVLANHASQFLTKSVQYQAKINNLNIELYEADYNQIQSTIVNPNSEMYAFKPDYVYISHSARKLIPRFYGLDAAGKRAFASEFVSELGSLVDLLASRAGCQVIVSNLEEIDDSVFGSLGSTTVSSLLYQLRVINTQLRTLCMENRYLHLADVQSLILRKGYEQAFSPQQYITADLTFSTDFTVLLGEQLVQLLKAFTGDIKKCLILDLDNTLWGGIIGDDGLENIQLGDLGIGKAFSDLQKWAKQLKNRGIILAVCSKNQEMLAKEPFEKHPDMALSLDDIAVFVANWSNKADNIRYIKEVLNIGYDSMVFLDDNPAERDIVKGELPEVSVPDLPGDPAEYLPFLMNLNLFETISYSENDSDRTRQYQEEAKRKALSKSFTDMSGFLDSLDMKGTFEPFSDFDIARIAQLTQRSNQFNLRTVRYTDSEIADIREGENSIGFSVKLSDKFGDYGLISVLIGRKQSEEELFIDTWIMSCRVLERGVEKYVLNRLVDEVKKLGFKSIVGEYLPTRKNGLVKDHYHNLGFVQKENLWYLDLNSYQGFDVSITMA